MASPLTHFSCLDDVIQVIYHLNRQLFLISKVQSEGWFLHVGLLGPDSRWWRGKWDEDDVLAAAGSKASSDDLQEMSEKLLECIVQGELFLSGWSKESVTFKLILGPSSEKPSHFRLAEISAEDAASYAAEIFCSIAREAQSRNCQLHGSSLATPMYGSSSYLNVTPASSSSKILENRGLEVSNKKREETKSKRVAEQPAPSNKRKARKEETQSPDPESKTKLKAAPKPIKGASLANPTKKARKYQAVQFESDED